MIAPITSARATMLGAAIAAAVALWALRDLTLLVGYAIMLAYVLLPVVNVIERARMPRGGSLPRAFAAGAVMFALVAVAGLLVALAIPRIASEASHFAVRAPEVIARIVADLRFYAAERGLSAWLDPAVESVRADAAGALVNLGGTLAQGVARLFGGLGNLLGFALLPLLAFYLLAESEAVRVSALRFVPEEARAELSRLGGAVDRALRSYVRGQAIVCLMTGVLVAAGLMLLGFPVALLLGLVAGLAELIPILGFAVAAVAIGLAGWSVSPAQALLGLAVYIGLNWVIGSFVTPRVMGRYLKMHPFVVTVSVLAGAQLLGPAGALLALPGAAVLQAVIGEWTPARAPVNGAS